MENANKKIIQKIGEYEELCERNREIPDISGIEKDLMREILTNEIIEIVRKELRNNAVLDHVLKGDGKGMAQC